MTSWSESSRSAALLDGSEAVSGRPSVRPGCSPLRPQLALEIPNYPRSPRRFEHGSHPFEERGVKWASGEVAERSKAHASKACVPIGYRGFESHPLRLLPLSGRRTLYLAATTHIVSVTKRRRGARAVEGARLESACTQKVPWVRIPPSPWKELSALGRR